MKAALTMLVLLCCTDVWAQEIKIIKLNELQTLIEQPGKNLKVINFWASWCGPCVREMPYFETVAQADPSVELYFVSLDFVQDLEKVKRMMAKNNIKAKTFLLDEKDMDLAIRTIDEDWSGAIPATLFVTRSGKKFFYEQAFETNELKSTINNILSTK